MGLSRRIRGKAASGNNKLQEPDDKSRKLLGLLSEAQKAVASGKQKQSLRSKKRPEAREAMTGDLHGMKAAAEVSSPSEAAESKELRPMDMSQATHDMQEGLGAAAAEKAGQTEQRPDLDAGSPRGRLDNWDSPCNPGHSQTDCGRAPPAFKGNQNWRPHLHIMKKPVHHREGHN